MIGKLLMLLLGLVIETTLLAGLPMFLKEEIEKRVVVKEIDHRQEETNQARWEGGIIRKMAEREKALWEKMKDNFTGSINSVNLEDEYLRRYKAFMEAKTLEEYVKGYRDYMLLALQSEAIENFIEGGLR